MSVAVRLKPILEWSNAVLVKQGMYAADAEIVSRRLIEAELLECTAGGLRWLPRIVAAMDVGDIDPRAQIVTVSDLPALAVLDGSTGVGQVAITKALELGVEKAKAVGSATIVVKNSRPLGDPTACLAVATSAGCVAGIMMACKPQIEPWPIGSCSAWGWPGADGSLVASELQNSDLFGTLPTVLGGTKPAAVKKKLFRDDAEHLCTVIDPSKCRPMAEFHSIVASAVDASARPAWMFDVAQWPATAEVSDVVAEELREAAKSMRIKDEW